MHAATRKGMIAEGTDTGMAEVVRWLYSDGRSSVLGGQDPPVQDDMSLGSLQARPHLTLTPGYQPPNRQPWHES